MYDLKIKARKFLMKSREKNPDISPEDNYSYYLTEESVRIGRQKAKEATEKYIKFYRSQEKTKKITAPLIKILRERFGVYS